MALPALSLETRICVEEFPGGCAPNRPESKRSNFFVRGIENSKLIVDLFARICGSHGGKRASLAMWVDSAHSLPDSTNWPVRRGGPGRLAALGPTMAAEFGLERRAEIFGRGLG